MLATAPTTTHTDNIPPQVIKLARRIWHITQREGNGRYVFEIVAVNPRLLLIVRDLRPFEDLGDG